MNLTNTQLKRIIKEELNKVLNENDLKFNPKLDPKTFAIELGKWHAENSQAMDYQVALDHFAKSLKYSQELVKNSEQFYIDAYGDNLKNLPKPQDGESDMEIEPEISSLY
jgi:hypothetical protein|tara:strand:+ start:149 stop:478 length:330 start_codon:yes stop_codon:yes gene_type:complete